MRIKTILALVNKEIKQIKRDTSSILVAFVLPMIILIVFGYGMSFNIENINIDIVTKDSGKITNDLTDLYMNSKYFKTNIVNCAKDAAEDLESGKTMGTIIIPDNFSANIAKGAKAEIQILSDGTDTNTASYIENYASRLFFQYLKTLQKPTGPSINVVNRLWFNPSTESINFLMSGALTMILSIVGTFLTSLVVAKEWERGTMEAMISTPASIIDIIISKLIPYFILCIFALVFSLAFGMLVFDIPFQGSFLAMAVLSGIFITVSLLIGLLISTTAKDQFVAAIGSALVSLLPTLMLSGFVFEINTMPMWLQYLTCVFPARYYVSSVRTLFLVGDIWEVLIRDITVLFAMCVVLFLAVKQKMRKNVE